MTSSSAVRPCGELHLWVRGDRTTPENTSCRFHVLGVDELYAEYSAAGVIHPNAPLEQKPWGLREFGILDPSGNLIQFAERPAR